MLTLKDFGDLSPAESKLIEAAPSGDRVTIGSGDLPGEASPDTTIRAGLIRMLLLQEDASAPLHEKGVRLRGAWIIGVLDMQGADCSMDLTLSRCVLEKPISFVNARMRGVFLVGSQCPGLAADNARFEGSVYLRGGFEAHGEVSLPSANIAGDLQICGARLSNPDGNAIFAASMKVGGSIYLGDYPYDSEDTTLACDGSVILSSIATQHDLHIRFLSVAPGQKARLGFATRDGAEGSNLVALSLVRAEVGGVFFFKDLQIAAGVVNLSGATVRRLNDEPAGDDVRFPIRLDGFEYLDFAQHTDISVRARLSWLDRRPDGIEFRAQPYEQLARVLTRIGHREDAQAVLMRKERLLRRENRSVAASIPEHRWRVPFMWMTDGVLRFLIGYGYRPGLALVWAVVLTVALGIFFDRTWEAGDMAPNAAPILVSKDWVAATQSHPENPAAFWSQPGQAGQDYETFNAYAYAADLLVPIVNLGQEQAWAPSTSRSPLGRFGWWVRWFAKAIGWIVTALGAAAVTGIIRRE